MAGYDGGAGKCRTETRKKNIKISPRYTPQEKARSATFGQKQTSESGLDKNQKRNSMKWLVAPVAGHFLSVHVPTVTPSFRRIFSIISKGNVEQRFNRSDLSRLPEDLNVSGL